MSKVGKERHIEGVITCVKDLDARHPGHFQFEIQNEWLALNSEPGQFLHIAPPGTTEMLRRPISVMKADPANSTVSIVFRVVGEGTKLLSGSKEGDTLDIIGPLGNGFGFNGYGPAILAGGGVGIPPLVYLAKKLKSSNYDLTVFLGARNSETLLCVEDFRELGVEPVIATEDGSVGFKGLITGSMNEIEFNPDSVVYACGPVPMLRAIAKWSLDRGLECQISLENKLGCGVGACLGCSAPVRESDGKISYERVCSEGPVFDARRIAFDLM